MTGLRRSSLKFTDVSQRAILETVAKNLGSFVRWPSKALLFWPGCDRVPESVHKPKYFTSPMYLKDIARSAGIKLDTRINGPAIRALREFVNEQHAIEVRQHPKLHDRYVSFNDRCWLVGSSLKDGGKKTFNLIEFVDAKAVIVSEIEAKWREAQPYS